MIKEFKGTPAPWTYSPQDGTKNHCFAAQVWDSTGHNLATIESTEDSSEATANACLIATAPELLNALELMTWVARSYDMGRHKEDIEKAQCVIDKALRQS